MVDSRIPGIAAAIAATEPRVVVIVAPPGYGKLQVAHSYAAATGREMLCVLPPNAERIAQTMLDALVAPEPAKAAKLAVDRLARGRSNQSVFAREALRAEWPASYAGTFILHDMVGTLATAIGADIFAQLIQTMPLDRRLVVCARAALPPALDATIPAGAARVHRKHLALPERDVLLMATEAGVDTRTAHRIFQAVEGWPIVTRLLVDQARAHPDDDSLDGLHLVPPNAIFSFVVHRSIASLDDQVREALIVASLLPAASYVDLVRLLGPQCDDAVFARMASLPFVDHEGDRVTVHPEIPRLLRERFPGAVAPLYEQTLKVLVESGRYVAAARIALDAEDGTRAAETIDVAPPFTAAPIPMREYERVVDRIDGDLITRYPNLWVITIPYRAFAIDPSLYVHEAETVYFCLPIGAPADQRAAVLMMLASAYTNVGRAVEADELISEALDGFAAEGQARASLLNFSASLRGIEGRLRAARALAQEASALARDSFGINQTLHYIEAHEAAFRGRQDRIVVIFDELMNRRGRDEPPLYRAYVGMNGALFSWANGDDAAFERYLTAFEDALTPAIEAVLRPLLDAARGRSAVEEYRGWPLYAAMTSLYRMSAAATPREALEAARAAAEAADRRSAPYTRTLAHLAVYVLDETARSQEASTLRELVSGIESTEWREAVCAVLEGRSAGILDAFIRRRVLQERTHREPAITIELLAGRVSRDGQELKLREKEFELVALLASSRGSLSRNEIGEALWEHLDVPEWANNLKVTMFRIRKAAGARNITIKQGSRHRLSPSADVDLRRAEALVRTLDESDIDDRTRTQLRAVLDGFLEGIIERYERYAWSHALVARLNDLVCACGLALAADAFRHEHFADALAFATRVRDIDPLNEKGCEMVIRAFYARGDVDAARREYQRYAAALAREVSATPSASFASILVIGA